MVAVRLRRTDKEDIMPLVAWAIGFVVFCLGVDLLVEDGYKHKKHNESDLRRLADH